MTLHEAYALLGAEEETEDDTIRVAYEVGVVYEK